MAPFSDCTNFTRSFLRWPIPAEVRNPQPEPSASFGLETLMGQNHPRAPVTQQAGARTTRPSGKISRLSGARGRRTFTIAVAVIALPWLAFEAGDAIVQSAQYETASNVRTWDGDYAETQCWLQSLRKHIPTDAHVYLPSAIPGYFRQILTELLTPWAVPTWTAPTLSTGSGYWTVAVAHTGACGGQSLTFVENA